MTLVPHFITNLAERLVSHAKTCLTEDIESVDFVASAAQLLTVSISSMYRGLKLFNLFSFFFPYIGKPYGSIGVQKKAVTCT